jgi:putative ABC transport system permease protein
MLLSACGAALGSFIAALTGPALRAIVPASIPRGDEIGVDFWIVAFFALAAAATTMLAALAPAWRGTRFDIVKLLKQSAGGASSDRSASRWRQGLVGAQSAVSTALLLTAALLIASFWKLSHVPLGFDGDRVLTVEMRPISSKYNSVRSPAPTGGPQGRSTPSPALIALQRDLVARVRALPGVLDAGLTSAVPFRGIDMVYRLDRIGTERSLAANARFVDPGYFSVLRVPLVRGRLFTARDTLGSPQVMLVSEEYARQMFGSEDPLGKQIDFDGPVEVVGIVADMRYKSFDTDAMAAAYFPSAQHPSELTCVVARLAPSAGNLEPALRAIVKDLDPDLPAMNITTIDRILSSSVADRRFYTTATTALATLALILTVGGLIVVVSRAVVERRREMAIRAALGARSRDLIRSVMLPGMTPVVVGIGSGLAAVSISTGLLRHFLFHTSPHAPAIYAGVAMLVLAAAFTATLVPARRAATVSPSAILRAE